MRNYTLHMPLHGGRGFAVIIMVAMMTAGCAPGKSAIAPDVRSKLKEQAEITAFRYYFRAPVLLKYFRPGDPVSGTHVNDSFKLTEVREEPLIPLMDSFLAALRTDLKLDNIRTLPDPRHHHPKNRWALDRVPERGYDLDQIQRTFQTGLVFDFDRNAAVFDNDYVTPFLKARYRVHLDARVRLIRVNDQEILWQGVCEIIDGGLTLEDFPGASEPSEQITTVKVNAVVQEKLDGAVRACVKELVTQFMGK